MKLVAGEALLRIGKGHRQVCGINAELSAFTATRNIWLEAWFNIFRKQLVREKDGPQYRRSGLITVDVSCRAHLWEQLKTTRQGVELLLLVYHNRMKAEQQRQDVLSRGNMLSQCVFGKERNSIFSPLYACPPQVTLAHKRNQTKGERYTGGWNANTPVSYSEHVNSRAWGGKKIHVTHFLWWFIAWFVTRMHPAYFLSY